MPQIENIIINKTLSDEGWDKLDKISCRSIKIGYLRNCNDDLINDKNLKEKIENILKKFNINEYELIESNDNNEYSFDIRLNENAYCNFKKSIES